MRETQVQSLGWEDPLEKEMATHSSILAWRIPWMEEPGRLQATGSQRVGHDWATSPHLMIKLWNTIWPLKAEKDQNIEKDLQSRTGNLCIKWGFPVGSVAKNPPARRCGFYPWVGKIPWRRAWQPTPVFLPGKSHRQRSLVGYSPWGLKESKTKQLSMHEHA